MHKKKGQVYASFYYFIIDFLNTLIYNEYINRRKLRKKEKEGKNYVSKKKLVRCSL